MIDAGHDRVAAATHRARRTRRLGTIAGVVLVSAALALALALLLDPFTTNARVSQAPPDKPIAGQAAPGAQATLTPRDTAVATQNPLATTTPILRAGASASFRRLAASLPGRVELAVTPLGAGPTEILGGDTAAHGWSTTKVPVLVALLRARGESGLTAQERVWASAAITVSDNQAILDLFGDLEQLKGGLVGASDYIDTILRRSGDDETTVATAPPPPGGVTTFGQTEWSPSETLKFFRALARGCLLPTAQTTYVLDLMENIEPSESWGLGSAHFGVPVAFKGGWGPEPTGSYLVRQSAIIDPGSSRGVAVAIVALPSETGSGSFTAGTQMLTDTAQWLQRELRLTPHPSVGCTT
jgi:hypothetical protein